MIIFSLFFISCGHTRNHLSNAQIIDDSASWAPDLENQNINDAYKLSYNPLKLGYCNLSDLVGKDPQYVWVKISFVLEPDLRNKQLGMVIPYLHYAEKAWLNGVYIGEYGRQEAPAVSSFYQSHFYSLPLMLLTEEGENVVFLKVLSQGLGTVSEGILIDEYASAKFYANSITYSHSKLYMFFAGILVCAFIFFFILYLARKERYILSFTFICIATVIFLTYFYAQEIPIIVIETFGDLLFTKIFLCCGCYLTIFTIVAFMMSYIGMEQPKVWVLFKHIVLVVSILLTLVMPNYHYLMKITVAMIITYFTHFIMGVILIIKYCFDVEKRKKAIISAIGFFPLASTIVADVFVRFIFRNIDYPYFAIFGWQITVTFFIFYLSWEYGHVYKRNKRLTEDLQAEIDLQTIDLIDANNKLEQENIQNQREMNMAAFVQQRFFPVLSNYCKNWDLGMVYSPLEKVSGDLYDFYRTEDGLAGFSLFDASGHGVAAALVTMISKNIIKTAFNNSKNNQTFMAEAMNEVNERFSVAKGDVENYLTGIMVRFTEQEDGVKLEMANAGHPYPCYYSAKEKKIIDLKAIEIGDHFGAIGMAGIEVAFPEVEYTMEKGDILVCFTDGITDTADENRNSFGRKRVEDIILENSDAASQKIVDELMASADEFRGARPRDDDISIIVLKRI